MEPFDFYERDAAGGPRELRLDIDLPLIVALGAAYAGFENWTMAGDVRYLNYADADGFGDPAVFDGTAALQGLGWDDVIAVSLGAQRRVSDRLLLRGGWAFNESPIGDEVSFFNMASPLFYKHTLSAGASVQLSAGTAVNLC